ncbi:MAG: hypothetical protein ACC726_12685 [Chloroflexota bacterium]
MPTPDAQDGVPPEPAAGPGEFPVEGQAAQPVPRAQPVPPPQPVPRAQPVPPPQPVPRSPEVAVPGFDPLPVHTPAPGESASDFVSSDETTAAASLDSGVEGLPGEPADESDWLDRICPYLLSEDGTWRSTQPDLNHRCTAQDPPGTLPSAFQERFCLTDRHVRCEMYKYAQSARSAALEQGGIPAEQVQGARFRPSVRSVPLALGPAEGSSQGGNSGGLGRHRALLAIVGIGAAVIILFILILLLGGSGGSGGLATASASPAAVPTAEPTPKPTPEPTPQPTLAPGASPTAVVAQEPVIVVRYQVQEGEALLKIAEAFGVTRRSIRRANEGMVDRTPFVSTDDIILVPVSPDIATEDIEALPGFIEFVELP